MVKLREATQGGGLLVSGTYILSFPCPETLKADVHGHVHDPLPTKMIHGQCAPSLDSSQGGIEEQMLGPQALEYTLTKLCTEGSQCRQVVHGNQEETHR